MWAKQWWVQREETCLFNRCHQARSLPALLIQTSMISYLSVKGNINLPPQLMICLTNGLQRARYKQRLILVHARRNKVKDQGCNMKPSLENLPLVQISLSMITNQINPTMIMVVILPWVWKIYRWGVIFMFCVVQNPATWCDDHCLFMVYSHFVKLVDVLFYHV